MQHLCAGKPDAGCQGAAIAHGDDGLPHAFYRVGICFLGVGVSTRTAGLQDQKRGQRGDQGEGNLVRSRNHHGFLQSG